MQRRRDSNRAWFEYIPALVPDDTDDLRIYRNLRWGQQVQLLITDLRSYRTPPTVPNGLQEELGLPMVPAELMDILDGGRNYQDGNPRTYFRSGTAAIPILHATVSLAACWVRNKSSGSRTSCWQLKRTGTCGPTPCRFCPCGWI